MKECLKMVVVGVVVQSLLPSVLEVETSGKVGIECE